MIAELVGPAGAGKSTVLRILARRDPRIQAGIEVGRWAHAPALAPRVLALLPAAADLAWRAPAFLWHNARHIARLEGLDAIVSADRSRGADRVIAFAEGPLFLLTRLLLAAERQPMAGGFLRLWSASAARWTGRLDLVVWLDAPDAVLANRIRGRAKQHRVKGAGDDAIHQFFAEYRRAYGRVLNVCPPARAARLMRLDSATSEPEQLADAILAALPGAAA